MNGFKYDTLKGSIQKEGGREGGREGGKGV